MKFKKVVRYLILICVSLFLGSGMGLAANGKVANLPSLPDSGKLSHTLTSVSHVSGMLPIETLSLRYTGAGAISQYLLALGQLADHLSASYFATYQKHFHQLPDEYQDIFGGINQNISKAYYASDQLAKEVLQAKLQAAAELAAKKAAQVAAAKKLATQKAAVQKAAAQQAAQQAAQAAAEKQAQQQAQQQPTQQAQGTVAPEPDVTDRQEQQSKITTQVADTTKPAATKAMAANTIDILGQWIGIEDSQGSAAAPYDGNAGYWQGDGSTTDGLTTHIIGHNPGIFNIVLSLQVGDQVTVVDRQGQSRVYTVYALLDVNDQGVDRAGVDRWASILNQQGEAISLQTCIDDYWNRMVLAK